VARPEAGYLHGGIKSSLEPSASAAAPPPAADDDGELRDASIIRGSAMPSCASS
jgi:hypothetical protein